MCVSVCVEREKKETAFFLNHCLDWEGVFKWEAAFSVWPTARLNWGCEKFKPALCCQWWDFLSQRCLCCFFFFSFAFFFFRSTVLRPFLLTYPQLNESLSQICLAETRQWHVLSYNQKTDALGGIKPHCVTYTAHEVQACAVLFNHLSVCTLLSILPSDSCWKILEGSIRLKTVRRGFHHGWSVWISAGCGDVVKREPESVLSPAKAFTGTYILSYHDWHFFYVLEFSIYNISCFYEYKIYIYI